MEQLLFDVVPEDDWHHITVYRHFHSWIALPFSSIDFVSISTSNPLWMMSSWVSLDKHLVDWASFAPGLPEGKFTRFELMWVVVKLKWNPFGVVDSEYTVVGWSRQLPLIRRYRHRIELATPWRVRGRGFVLWPTHSKPSPKLEKASKTARRLPWSFTMIRQPEPDRDFNVGFQTFIWFLLILSFV